MGITEEILSGTRLAADRGMAKQTSRKAGVRSLGEKLNNSRHGFDSQPASRPVAGANGEEPRRRRQQPGTATARAGKGAALRAQRRG